MRRVALFGGSFNPPHVGHQMAMLYALSTARVERLVMVPCFRHPFEKVLAPFEQRLEMCRLAAAPMSGAVEVSDIERRLGGDSLTLNTVKALHSDDPGVQLIVVIGEDLVSERERWYGWEELRTLVEFAVVGRADHADTDGNHNNDVVIPNISSTEIRDRIAHGRPIAGWLPATVHDYVTERGIYRSA